MADLNIIAQISEVKGQEEEDLLNFGREERSMDTTESKSTTEIDSKDESNPEKDHETDDSPSGSKDQKVQDRPTKDQKVPPTLLKPPVPLLTKPTWLPKPNPFFVPKLPVLPTFKHKTKKKAEKKPEVQHQDFVPKNRGENGQRQILTQDQANEGFPPAKGIINLAKIMKL